jgi:ATP-dependent Clp protease adaptor protein ClpS
MSQAQNTSDSNQRQTAPVQRPQRKELPTFNVVLLDDNDHTHDYVIDMLQRLFAHEHPTAMALAQAVDSRGRAIVCTTHKERAELKRDQILAFGCDYRIPNCQASMRAVLEPAVG